MLFDELPLQTLQESIQKVGVLVPLTVYRASGSEKFTILDGQRRWICAQRIGLEEIPINEVAEPNVAQNIVTMFQIHKLRKDWELMPTALKLGVLMQELEENGDRQLASLTGLDIAVVTRCKKLLWYPSDYHEMMLYAEPNDRIKADFFIELYSVLTDRVLNRADWFDRDNTTKIFLRKYQEGLSGFRSITDFRKIKQHIATARAADREREILSLFREFLHSDTMLIEDLEIDTARYHKQASTFRRSLGRITQQLGEMDVDTFIGEEGLWSDLEELLKLIQAKLREADRRGTDE